MQYFPNLPPEMLAPGASALNRVLESGLGTARDIIVNRRAKTAADLETGRQREVEQFKSLYLPELTSRDLTPTEEIELQDMLGRQTYTHDYRGLLGKERQKEVPLLVAEDLSGISAAREQGARDRAAAAQAKFEIEAPYELPLRYAQEQELGYPPTTIGPKGAEFSIRDKTYAETEPYKAETSRYSATRPRAGGGGGGATSDKLLDPTTETNRWADNFLNKGMNFGQGLMGIVDQYTNQMLGATTQAEVQQILDAAKADVTAAQSTYENEDPGRNIFGDRKKRSPEVLPDQAGKAQIFLEQAAANRARTIARTGEFELQPTGDTEEDIFNMF